MIAGIGTNMLVRVARNMQRRNNFLFMEMVPIFNIYFKIVSMLKAIFLFFSLNTTDNCKETF